VLKIVGQTWRECTPAQAAAPYPRVCQGPGGRRTAATADRAWHLLAMGARADRLAKYNQQNKKQREKAPKKNTPLAHGHQDGGQGGKGHRRGDSFSLKRCG